MVEGVLDGASVLVVEDEMLISMMLTDMLEQLGCTAIGPAVTLGEAWPLFEAGAFDAAVLDVHVDGREIYDLADAVRARRIPLVIATGSGADSLPERFRNAVLLPKPYSLPALDAALRRAGLEPSG